MSKRFILAVMFASVVTAAFLRNRAYAPEGKAKAPGNAIVVARR